MFRAEFNAQVHALAALIVVASGLALGIDRFEWLILVLTIAGVISLEAVNTAFEALCDVAYPDFHPQVERAKDVAAGAVLIAAIAAAVVGILIFGPKLLAILQP
jgi:diacylglycerol kinase (ATP)